MTGVTLGEVVMEGGGQEEGQNVSRAGDIVHLDGALSGGECNIISGELDLGGGSTKFKQLNLKPVNSIDLRQTQMLT